MSFDPVVEIVRDGHWFDISTPDVTGRNDIKITRGRANESTRVSPSTCELELNNKNGKYSPRNPVGPYYGQFGRNVPIRVSTREITDTFTRTTVNGWGSTDGGLAWSTSGSGGSVLASDWQVAAGVGTHSIPATSAFRRSYLNTALFKDVDVSVTVTVPVAVTGGDIEIANIMLRGTSAPLYYVAYVTLGTSGLIGVGIRFGGTSSAEITARRFVVSYTPGQALRVRAQIEGQTIRVKAWTIANGEFDDWIVTGHDSTLTAAGYVGVRTGVTSTNTNTLPLVIPYDDFEVRAPRFEGEVSALPTRWDVTGNASWIPIEAAGAMRRIGRGDAPVGSPPRRLIMSHGSTFYWSLEDASGLNHAIDLRGLGGPFTFVGQSSRFGQGQLESWLPNVASVQSGDTLTATAADDPDVIGRSVEYARTGAFNSDETFILTEIVGFGTTRTWKIRCDGTGAGIVTLTFPNASTQSATVPSVFDGSVHHIRLTCDQVGSDVNYELMIDGIAVLTGTKVGETLYNSAYFEFVGAGLNSVATAIGHVRLGSATLPYTGASAYLALQGYAGETAGARIQRLCSEGVDELSSTNAIDFDYVGDLADTALMGPQRIASFLALLQECADADRGVLYEPRSSRGLAYRTLHSLLNQNAALALDYSAGQLSPPFEPIDDDQLTVNDVVVKRVSGGEYRATQRTGALSVEPPTIGIGYYRAEETLNVRSDVQLPSIAGWIKHIGTTNEARYPRISVNRARPVVALNTALSRTVADANIGDRLTVDNLTDLSIYGQVSQLVQGYDETLSIYEHVFTFNCSPETPYRVVQLTHATYGKIDSKGSTLFLPATSGATSIIVDIGGFTGTRFDTPGFNATRWTSAAGDLPIPITLAGEDMSVTAVTTGASFVSVGTVAHGVNASVTPGMPAGAQAGDLLLVLAAIRDETAAVNVPTGYQHFGYFSEHLNLFGKIHTGTESAPTVSFTSAVANSDTSAQMAAFRGVSLAYTGHDETISASAQNIAVSALTNLKTETTDLLVIYYGWKKDDWTSVATIAGATEISEPSTTTGNDQGIVWDYQIFSNQIPFGSVAAQTFTVTGGVAAATEGRAIAFVPRIQTMTVTRAVNGVAKSHAAGEQVQLTRRATLAL